MERPFNEDQLTEALRAISPEGCAVAVLSICGERESVFSEEFAPLRGAPRHRQQEFLCGRACARAALSGLGGGGGPIKMDAERVPVWPKPFLGSIAHSKGFGAAVAARNSEIGAIGVDLERIDRLSAKAQQRVVHPDERSFVKGEQRRATVLFSVKEAFFKMQYPIWRRAANFPDLVLEAEDAEEEPRIRIAELGECFSEALRAQAAGVQIRCRYVDPFVVSICWMPA